MIPLFEMTDAMFTKPHVYETYKSDDKRRNCFLINRFFAIKHPTTAQSLNFNGINPVAVVDLWQIFGRRIGKTPFWFYTKTKKTEAEKAKIWTPDEDIKKIYMERHQLKEDEFNRIVKWNEKEMKEYFAKLKKQMSY